MDDPYPLCIVQFSAEHLDQVETLEKQCFSTPWSRDGFIEELSNPMAVFAVAVIDGKVAGYAGMHHVVDEGYITNIAVAEDMRRAGVATALLDYLKAYAKENRMAFITLEVRVSNEGAIALYEQNGFERVGIRKDFYTLPTEDALLMTLEF